MRFAVFVLLLLLMLPFSTVAEVKMPDLIRCEYRIFGGMENEDLTYLLTETEQRQVYQLAILDRGEIRNTYRLFREDMEALADLLFRYNPETWATLQNEEEMAMDAPTHQLILTLRDGTEYSADSDNMDTKKMFQEARCFLESYTISGAETFELSFTSFEGGGPEYLPVLSAPEKVRVGISREYDEPVDLLPPGAGYREKMVFYGRIPGKTELTVKISGALIPVTPDGERPPEKVYVLEVDNQYNVTLLEQAAR